MRRSKLSQNEKAAVLAEHAAGCTISSLAKRYDVSFNTIKRIVDPEAYAKHLKSASQYNSENLKRIEEQRSKSLRRFSFSLHRIKDGDLIDVLNGKENVTQYIRDLIIEDIEKEMKAEPLRPMN